MNFGHFAFRFLDRIQGTHTLEILPVLQKLEFDHSKIEVFQNKMLRALLKWAFTNVPHYHDLLHRMKLNPYYDDAQKVFSKMPTLNKAILRENFNQLISNYPKRCVLERTSGSTGIPLKTLKDYDAISFGSASFYEGLLWYGYDIGDPFVRLWGRRPVASAKEKIVRLKNILKNWHDLDAHSMSNIRMEEYCKKISSIRPKVLYGYVSSVELINRFMLEHNYRFEIPIGVTTAEKLFESQRKTFSSIFGKTYDQYGSAEVPSIAFECPLHEVYHTMGHVIVQVMGNDQQEVSEDQTGRLIVTDLTNYKMPLIKYEIGDLATRAEKECCSCGRKLGLLKNIEGRSSDIIIGLNNNRVHGEFFSHLIENSGFADKYKVRQFQVIQKTKELLLFKLSTNLEPLEDDLDRLSSVTRTYLGPIEIEYEFVENILPHASGKFRFTISEV